VTWIIPSRLLSACAQASGCSTSALTSPSAELALWATSSGTASPRPSSWSGWKTRPWSRRLFGQAISQPSRGATFTAWWTSLLRASRASRTPSPALGGGWTMSGGSGPTSSQAFAHFDLASSSWKTSPACDLLGDWLPYSETWPRAGIASHGRACELPTWAPVTSASACSSSVWPTACATDAAGAARHGYMLTGHSGTSLTDAIRQWPTPAARDHKGENGEAHLTAGSGRLHLDQLPNFVRFSFSHPAPTPTTGSRSSDAPRTSLPRLNPAFAAWLMGMPWWWTHPAPINFARSEMASWLFRLRSLCDSCCGPWAPEMRAAA